MANFFIVWGPTLLFILMLIGGFLIGMMRGFRKSLILFFHMLAAFTICLIIYLILVNKESIDASLVSFANKWITKFSDNTLQGLLNVDPGLTSLKDILLQKVISSMSEEDLMYHLVVDNAAYIYAIVEMIYRVILFSLIALLYWNIIFILYIIYFFAYPVRRKARKVNRQFQKGEIDHPYRKKRLLGGAVGFGRALIVGVFSFSFLGALLFVVTGGESMPSRQEAREEEVDFNNETFNTAYDYYSVVCEMSDSGIFKVLNGIKDPSKTPFYFYMSDLVLQGRISDPTLEVEDKFYLRDETGAYVGFVKDIFQLMVKYSTNEELQALLSDSDTDAKMTALTNIMSKDGFKEEFNRVVDQFEEKPFMKYLILSSLTSLINHIDLATNNDPTIVNLVNTIFKGEDALKVTDLMNFNDVKTLFKGLVDVVATSTSSEVVKLSAEEEVAPKANETKKYILYARKFLPYIQNLTIFQDDSQNSKGNILIRKLYLFSAENFVEEDVTLPTIPEDISWMNEFNILFDVADPLLGLGYNVFDPDTNQMINNLLDMFKGANASENETYYDDVTAKISESSLLDVVFKSSMVGNTLTQAIQNMTANEEAGMPINDISFSGENGECVILLSSFKHLLKNDGKKLYEALTEDSELKGNTIKSAFEILNKEVKVSETENSTLLDVMMESKVLHYMLSSVLVYGKFGTFEFYIPDSVSDIKQEGSGEEAKTYRIVKLEEISKIVHTLSKCADELVPFIDEPKNADYAALFKNNDLIDGIDQSIILKGTIANLFINSTENQELLVLPKDYDHPDKWIETKEIDYLIDAVVSLGDEKTEDGESLINQLIAGTIKTKDLLNLSENTINLLFTSTVLRYSISDSITSLGKDNDFEIVVPRRDIDILAAETTTEKTVNVVKQDSLTKIFTDIDMIISFDDKDQITLNPTNIFNHKTELVQNDVLHATIINYLIKMSKESENSIIVPELYQADFEKFKTDTELTDNLWFGPTTAENEIYKVLDFIESCIADETGAIPADFSFENDLSNQIKIKNNENSINEISSSALLNATLSHHIITNLATPVDLYQNQLIEANELNELLKCSFLVLGKDEIGVNDIKTIEDKGLILKESMIDDMLKSEIICVTISDYVTKSESVLVPTTSTEPVELVNKEASNMVKHSEQEPELSNMLYALMNVFGEQKEGETEKSLDVKNVSTDHIVLTREDKETIKNSLILQATISKHIIDKSNQGIVIPNDQSILTRIAVVNHEEEQTIIQSSELDKYLDSAFAMFEKEDGKLYVNEIQPDNVYIKKPYINEITKSVIMNATMLDQMLGIDENIIVPIIENEIVVFERLNFTEQRCYKVLPDEMSYLISAFIDMIGTNDQIKTNEIDVSNIKIDASIDVTKSRILAATIGNQIIVLNDLIIPQTAVAYNQAIATKDATSVNKDLILTEELKKLTDSLFSMVNEIQINNGASNIDVNELTLRSDKMSTILGSSIMTATMSDKLFIDTIYIPNQPSVVEDTFIYGKTDSEITIQTTELEKLFKGIFAMLGKNEIQIVELQNVDSFKTIKKDETIIDTVFDSEILKTTISDVLNKTDSIKKLSDDIVEADVYHVSKISTTESIVNPEETLRFFLRLNENMLGDEISMVNFTLDKVSLPKTLEVCTRFVESNCITATISSEVMGIDSSKIVILDECKTTEYSKTPYIKQQELAQFIYALSIGLGCENVNKVKEFSTITVPENNELDKIEALTSSDIVRATISRIALNDNEAVIIDSTAADTTKKYNGEKVVLFTAEEIKILINGINTLNMGSFDRIQINLRTILSLPVDQRPEALDIIAKSAVFKSMMSVELTKTISGVPQYQLLTSDTETIQLSTGLYTYDGPNALGKYILQAPTNGMAYTGFSATTLVNQDLFTTNDILALQGVTISY